jgi:hypothetical protein
MVEDFLSRFGKRGTDMGKIESQGDLETYMKKLHQYYVVAGRPR